MYSIAGAEGRHYLVKVKTDDPVNLQKRNNSALAPFIDCAKRDAGRCGQLLTID